MVIIAATAWPTSCDIKTMCFMARTLPCDRRRRELPAVPTASPRELSNRHAQYPPRVPDAHPHAVRHDDRRALAGARHWCQRRDLLLVQPDASRAAPGAECGAARGARRPRADAGEPSVRTS